MDFDVSGRRVFFASAAGRLLHASNASSAYSGTTRRPHYGAAMVGWEKPEILINDDVAVGAIGRDGNLWSTLGS